jgi:hypothetical protein
MDKKEYNGWTNYETWLVKLWMDNEQSEYEYWQSLASEWVMEADENTDMMDVTYAFADSIKEYHMDRIEDKLDGKLVGFIADLLNASMNEVNWYEIAEHLLEDAKE